MLVSGVAAISLGIWIASGTVVTEAETILSWGGLTFALSWGTLGISLMTMGRPGDGPAQPSATRNGRGSGDSPVPWNATASAPAAAQL